VARIRNFGVTRRERAKGIEHGAKGIGQRAGGHGA